MNHRLIVIVVGASSATVGFMVGYRLAEQRLSEYFEERLVEETAGMREFYTNIPQKKFATPEAAVAELVAPEVAASAVAEYQGDGQKVAYHKIVKSEVVVPQEYQAEDGTIMLDKVITANVFEQRGDPTVPYIISEEVYMQNDSGYPQVSLTYYEEDDKLTDERDDLIEDVEATVGLDFKVNFGKDASDENTVYIRNERLTLDFEVAKDERSYAKQVLDEDPLPEVEKISARMRRERAEGK